MRSLYGQLIQLLAPLGQEGDYYGISDFAVRPDLRWRPNLVGTAPHVREFTITILSEEFFRGPYLSVLCRFLRDVAANYRIWVDQHFDPAWVQTIILTKNAAYVYCTSPEEMARLKKLLENP